MVDAARLVPLGADHVQAAELEHAVAELDVGTAAGHVGRDRDGAGLARVLDDLGLALVVLGVQDLVLDALALEQVASFSDFSIEIVPTSTGWPGSWRSTISSTTAWNFSSSVLETDRSASMRGPARWSGP